MTKLKLGGMLYLVGIIGGLLLGLLAGLGIFTAGTTLTLVLVVVGLGLGLFNISKTESVPVMVAVLIFGIGAGSLSILPAVGTIVGSMLDSLAKVIVPMSLVVAFNVIIKKAK